jgi:hypothetical protein
MALKTGLRFARWTAMAVFVAAGYRIAIWHHDDPLVLLVITPAFWTLFFAWVIGSSSAPLPIDRYVHIGIYRRVHLCSVHFVVEDQAQR